MNCSTSPSFWKNLVATDLSAEVQSLLAEKVNTIPEMRCFLAIKSYRELRQRLETAVRGKIGEQALRAVAFEMRVYALERPGLSAAMLRSPSVEFPECRREQDSFASFFIGILASVGVTGDMAHHALRILQSLVRSLVLLEIASSFVDPLDYDDTYGLAVEIYIRGLRALPAATDKRVSD